MQLSQLDIAWILLCSLLVLLMQAGFVCLESGLVRAKNSINVAAKNILDLCISGMIFTLIGYGLMFGESWNGLFGTGEFFLFKQNSSSDYTLFLFQLMFCGTAVTIIAGAVAERMRLFAFLFTAAVTAALIYPVVGHWVWGGSINADTDGWLQALGFYDFAGSTVVHSVGGWVALAVLLQLGPRFGRFDSSLPIQGHSIPLAVLGALLLWIGWMGFNGGSQMRLDGSVPLILVNTVVAGIGGGLCVTLLSWQMYHVVDVTKLINGVLAGLVSITASANVVQPTAAVIIGVVGGCIYLLGSYLLVQKKIDDVVDAIPVHGFAGVWGTLAVALFGDLQLINSGLDRPQQLFVQALGCASVASYVLLTSTLCVFVYRRWFLLRVTEQQEQRGLNIVEHNASTEILDLLTAMDAQKRSGDFSNPLNVDMHTETGQIAAEYNRIIEQVRHEASRTAGLLDQVKLQRDETLKSNRQMRDALEQLRRFEKFSVNRELRMIELKLQINELLVDSGMAPRYSMDEINGELEMAKRAGNHAA